MATLSKSKRTAAQNLAKALSHPLREEALTILTEREASAVEIANELDEKPTDVSYHIRTLVKLGHAEHVSSRPVEGAGAVEKVYKAVARPLIDVDEWAAMHPAVASHFAWRAASMPLEDFTKAVEGGLLEDPDEAWVTRTPMTLDAEGVRRMMALHRETHEKAMEIQAESDGRRLDSDEEGVRVSTSQLFFEIPTKRSE